MAIKLFVLGFVLAMFCSVILISTLGARKTHKDWSNILNNNNDSRSK